MIILRLNVDFLPYLSPVKEDKLSVAKMFAVSQKGVKQMVGGSIFSRNGET